jgi:6-phosphogluconolactonase
MEQLAQFFGEELAYLVSEKPEDSYFSLALSGGSTPKAVFNHLATNFKGLINWSKVLIFWSDERCVVPESEESNFRLAKESILDYVSIPATNIFRIKGEAEPHTEADRYSDIIRDRLPVQHGIPQFDLLMLGFGSDGHTASIFPSNIHLFGSEKLYAVSENPYNKQIRITVTGKMINNSRMVVFLVTGELKADRLAMMLEKKHGWDMLPASFVQPTNRELLWLIDDLAASKLLNGNNSY